MFQFVDVGDISVDVDPVSKNGVCFYPIPDADKYYPSVTSITSFKNAQFFAEWRRKIGEDELIASLLALLNGAQHFTTLLKIISKAT